MKKLILELIVNEDLSFDVFVDTLYDAYDQPPVIEQQDGTFSDVTHQDKIDFIKNFVINTFVTKIEIYNAQQVTKQIEAQEAVLQEQARQQTSAFLSGMSVNIKEESHD